MSQQKPSTPTQATNNKQGGFKKQNSQTQQSQQQQQQGGKTFNSSRGGSTRGRGGVRGGNPQQKRTSQKQNSKTIFVGRIFFDDLFTSNISSSLADKLKDQRVRLLKDSFAQFGNIESIESHVNSDDNNYMLITYDSRDSAKSAMQTFKSKDKIGEEMDKIKARLSQQKQFPPNVCPELFKYRYDWSDKPANKNITQGKKSTGPKTVIASTTQPISATSGTLEKKDKKKKAKTQATTPAQQQNDTQEQQQPAPQQKQPKAQPQKKAQPQQGSGDLQRQAEKAKLTEELKYLQNQQSHVSSELDAERKRAKERDERINRLSAELARIREEEQALTNKLNAENTYKHDGESRIQKLNQELSHMKSEEQIVLQKMSAFENLDNQKANGVY